MCNREGEATGPRGTAWCVGHGFMGYEGCAEIGNNNFKH